MKTICSILFLWFSLVGFVQSAPQTFSSSGSKVSLLELYTSEGCSSCPPAEGWLNNFQQDKRLWKEFIPVAFHVDYWNYIGWSDRFSSSVYSLRQKKYAAQNIVSAVYTPGVVLDGKEWRGWRFKRPLNLDKTKQVGRLTVDVDSDQVSSRFTTEQNNKQAFLNTVILGFDLTTVVQAGENKGKELQHDFVVLGYERKAMKKTKNGYSLSSKMPEQSEISEKKGLAVWVDYEDDFRPVQATGGWLEQ